MTRRGRQSGRERRTAIVAGAVLLSVGVVVVWCVHASQSLLKEDLRTTVLDPLTCEILLVALTRSSERPLQLPEGDIDDLATWLGEKRGQGGRRRETYRDGRGHGLVYRFPSTHQELLFDLYSVGPNGRDDGGLGDDVVGSKVRFSDLGDVFLDADVDRDWLLRNRERLNWDEAGKIVVDR